MGVLGFIALVAGTILLAFANQDWFTAQDAVGLGLTIVGAVLVVCAVVRFVIVVIMAKKIARQTRRFYDSF